MKMIRYLEPPDKIRYITFDEAIKWQKKAAAQCNYEYENDEDALEDFIVVHWGDVVEVDGCLCSNFATRVVGDGCSICNPEQAKWYQDTEEKEDIHD